MPRDAIPMAGVRKADQVMVEFVSHFNEDATQRVVGKVVDASTAEVAVSTPNHRYTVSWDGGVTRRGPDEKAPMDYGREATIYVLTRVDPALDDEGVEP